MASDCCLRRDRSEASTALPVIKAQCQTCGVPPADSTAYYTLIATILIGVIVLTVLQLQEISRSVRAHHAPLAVRLSLLVMTLVAIVSVLALAQTPRAARGAASWLTYRMAERVVAALLGISCFRQS